ncbi:folate-binding protein YgfZ [Legionella sp. W05-934-2]|uniref:CAF17-like 4Fe-4S cluster assembly/insertion protein YgfZ n=1 Tax=Legionella sp. W05-934-2 TaxID=1198649 RepID=UPI003461DB4F
MKQYTINDRVYTYSSDLSSELEVNSDETYLCQLDYLHCISVKGDKAGSFLQGQLSCDINSIDSTHYRTGMLCSLKGRIIALMDVIHCHDYQLVMEKDITARTLSVLEKAALISHVQLKPSTRYSVLGVIGPVEKIDLPITPPLKSDTLNQNEEACLYRIAENMHILLLQNEVADILIKNNQTMMKGSLLWHYYCLKINRPAIYGCTQGQFLPHRLDFHLQPTMISLEKGCFRGQEIIARTHYLAKLKHGYFTYVSHLQPETLDKIMLNDIEIGEVIDWCPMGENQFLIAASIKKEEVDPFLKSLS